MFEKIKTGLLHAKTLNDTRVLGLIAFGVVALLVSWSGVKAIQTNYGLQKEIASLEEQNKVKTLENENLKLKNEYYKTNEFLELEARRQFGKAAPGEKVVVVPKSVALSFTTDSETQHKAAKKTEIHKPTYQKNFEAWINFFLHRKQSE